MNIFSFSISIYIKYYTLGSFSRSSASLISNGSEGSVYPSIKHSGGNPLPYNCSNIGLISFLNCNVSAISSVLRPKKSGGILSPRKFSGGTSLL